MEYRQTQGWEIYTLYVIDKTFNIINATPQCINWWSLLIGFCIFCIDI